MKIYIFILLIFGIGCKQSASTGSHFTQLESISIIDVIDGKLISDQTVVLKDSIIFFVGKSWKAPRSAELTKINCEGKYLLPGLWDMHFHLCWNTNNDSLLFPPLLANGITGIRDMGGDLDIQNNFKNKIATNQIAGPEINGAGPFLDGNPPVMYDFTIPLDEQTNIPDLLDSLVSKGSDFIKTYSLIRQAELEQISNYVKSNELTFAGHLSEYVDPEISIELGQKSIEHLNRLDEIWNTDSIRLSAIADQMMAKNTWLCPTLLIYYLKANMKKPNIVRQDFEQHIALALKEEWESSKANRLLDKDSLDWSDQKRKFEKQLDLVKYLHEKGVKILAGSDFAGMPFVSPGLGLLQELQLLSQAGLSNAEVLRTATIHPAEYLAQSDKFGSVAVNKFADLIILNKNPLDNIKNSASIHIVFKKGKKVSTELSTKTIFE